MSGRTAPAWAGSHQLYPVTAAQRPDLLDTVPGILAARWPAFLLAGERGHGVDLMELLSLVPQHQILLLDPADEVLGVGLSVPLRWDRTIDGLPAGWDGAVSAAADLATGSASANAVCTLSITMAPEASGRGLATRMLGAVKAAAADVGIEAMISPVRPVLKEHYPLISFSRYLAWRTEDGRSFDPWVRLHERFGGVQVGVAYPSTTVRGTVAEWQQWTGQSLPGAGEYVVPGGLTTLAVDRNTDRATYREPHVWFVHRTTA